MARHCCSRLEIDLQSSVHSALIGCIVSSLNFTDSAQAFSDISWRRARRRCSLNRRRQALFVLSASRSPGGYRKIENARDHPLSALCAPRRETRQQYAGTAERQASYLDSMPVENWLPRVIWVPLVSGTSAPDRQPELEKSETGRFRSETGTGGWNGSDRPEAERGRRHRPKDTGTAATFRRPPSRDVPAAHLHDRAHSA